MVGKAQGIKSWQKLIAMFALALMLVLCVKELSIISRAETGTTNNTVNMRKTPSKNGDLVKKVEKGTSVEIVAQVDGKDGDGKKWYQVKVGGSEGYIRSDLVDKSNGNSSSGDGNGTVKTGEVEAVTPVGATISGSNTVRVRTSADTNTSNNILTTAAKGTEVTVIGKTIGTDKKTWYQVKMKVDGKDVVGYVRSDYLALTGEIKPYEADSTTPVESSEQPSEQPTDEPDDPAEEVEGNKRYETKLINDEWWLLDYTKHEQFNIDELFKAVDSYKEGYDKAVKKTKSQKGWMIFLIILVLALAGAVAYLFYKIREIKEDIYVRNVEKNTPKRTAERPRGDARSADGKDRPAIKDGLEPRSKEDRPVNGQRSTGNRPQGVRPGNGQPQQGVRPGNGQPQQGQRPANGQPQQGARPANGQPQQGARPANGQPQQGQRPANGQPQQGQRPGNGQPQQGQRPMNGQPQQGVRPAPEQAQGRPINPQPQQGAPRPKNFAQDGDDMEFEFLNWDSDE